MLAIVVLSLLLQLCVADILTSVDYASHVKFPTPIKPRNDGHLVGHLEQLGNQRPPLGQVPEYFATPTPRELWNNHVKVYRPAVLRGALKDSPALRNWTDENLIREYGQEEVLVEKKSEDRKSEPKRMTIEGFLDQYHKQNWYVVTILPDAMRKDVRVPKPLMCSSFRKNLQELNLWIGTKGTRSMLHYDADQIMHCVVTGRKDWILIHPDNKPRLDMVLGMSGQNSGFSHLPVDAIDEKLYPELWDVAWEYVTLYGGDCLYLPSQYLHQVRSFNRSISATMLFYPRDVFSDTDCKDVDLDGYKTLSDVYVYWTYVKGQETVDMGYQNPLTVKNQFMDMLKLSDVKRLSEEHCFYMSVLTQGHDFLQNPQLRNWLFAQLNGDGDGVVTYDEILNSNIEIWKQWCRINENPHGPVRSELTKHKKKTNDSAEFLPRNNDYHVDSSNALIFLKFLLRVKGKKNIITYADFAKSFQTRSGSPAESFLLIDSNYDGILTLKEVENLDRKSLRDFSRKYYGIKGTRIVGGGIFEEELEANPVEHLEMLNSIPNKLLLREGDKKIVGREEDEKEEEKKKMKAAIEMFDRLTSIALEHPGKQLTKDNFVKTKGYLQRSFGVPINMNVLFYFFDRGDKGYVSMEDLDFYSQTTPMTGGDEPVDSEDIAVVKKEKSHETVTPQNFIIKLISIGDEIREKMEESDRDEGDEDRDTERDNEGKDDVEDGDDDRTDDEDRTRRDEL